MDNDNIFMFACLLILFGLMGWCVFEVYKFEDDCIKANGVVIYNDDDAEWCYSRNKL